MKGNKGTADDAEDLADTFLCFGVRRGLACETLRDPLNITSSNTVHRACLIMS